jgi:hypothetical protein
MKLFHNPEYDKMRAEWQVAHDLYEGDHDTLSSFAYLWPHYIELVTQGKSPLAITQAGELRRARAQRTRYFNISEIVVSLWTSIFFRESPFVPDDCKAIFDSPNDYPSIKNIDGYGKDLFKFVKDDIFTPYLKFGRVFVLANAPKGKVETVAQERAMGLVPRLQALSPLCVTDWDIEHSDGNRIGRLNMLRHEYEYSYPRTTETTEPKCALRSEALRAGAPLTVFEYEAVDGDKPKVDKELEYTLLGTTSIDKLQEIPISYIIDRPWLRECNEESLRFHNLRSNKDNIQHNQGADSGFIAGNEAQTTEEIQALCEYTWKFLKEGSTAFKLPPVDVSGYERALDDSKATAFALGLNMLRMLPADSKEAPSAQSAAAEKENLYALVDSTLSDIENTVNQSISYAAEFKGIKDFEAKVKFDRSISEDTLTDFIALAQAFQDKLSKYPKAQKELLLKVAKKLDLSDDAIKEIETLVVKAEEPMSAEDVVNQALGGANGKPRPPDSVR